MISKRNIFILAFYHKFLAYRLRLNVSKSFMSFNRVDDFTMQKMNAVTWNFVSVAITVRVTIVFHTIFEQVSQIVINENFI